MKKSFSSILMMVFLCLAHTSFAQDKNIKTIKPMVIKFANLIGCSEPEITALTKFSDKENGIENAYLALIPSDIECFGGSGTSSNTIVVVNTASGRVGREEIDNDNYWKINLSLSEPIANVIGAPRALNSIFQKNGQLFATGLEYGPNDANCCPSIKSTYKLILNKKIISLSKDESKDFYTWTFVKLK